MFVIPTVTYAISAQWDLDPVSGDWDTAANWTLNGVPNGAADIATFGLSNTTNVSISADTEVNGIIFTPSASNAYTITANPELTLTISGVGIVNNSGAIQNFVTAVDAAGNQGAIVFTNTATAGSSAMFVNSGATISGAVGGLLFFYNSSTAADATFLNKGGAASGARGGQINFFDSSTAGSATITTDGAAVVKRVISVPKSEIDKSAKRHGSGGVGAVFALLPSLASIARSWRSSSLSRSASGSTTATPMLTPSCVGLSA
jgi:hypothetical protein